tara:strand:+ start:240 stop:521 length:282 start_codon:yes stop_codon:yes gene_type:complete
MTDFDNAIEKLLRRIERAANKNKLKKVQRLTTQLELLLNIQNQIEEQEEDTSGTDSSTNVADDNDTNPTLGPLEREDIQYEEDEHEEDEQESD